MSQVVVVVAVRLMYNGILYSMFRFLFAILLCVSFLSGCSGQQYIEHVPTKPATQRIIKWQEYSNTALVISTTSKRPALLYFTLDDCSSCKLMETETLNDPEVAYFINENFVPIKINAKQEDIVDKYKIDRFPTILILSSLKNSEIDKLSVPVKGKDLIVYLKLMKRMDGVLGAKGEMDKILEGLLNLGR